MSALQIHLIGELAVLRDGEQVPLPASRKTRALLAYLVLTGRPQRRDRLCDLLWDIPEDPRGALRWSLSKLRSVVNDEGAQRLVADRERLTFVCQTCQVDRLELNQLVADPSASLSALSCGLEMLNSELLVDCELPDQPEFQAWLQAEREQLNRLTVGLVSRLAGHRDVLPESALHFARRWQELAPFSAGAAHNLIAAHERLGQHDEARRLQARFAQHFHAAGMHWQPGRDEVVTASEQTPREKNRLLLDKQDIRFCRAADGVTIAHARVGQGAPLVKAANWLTHLELDWDAPIWSPLFRELARDHTFIRYDERGNGLSDWDVPEISFEKFVTDLETVVDALALKRFPLLGLSQGAAVCIEYAVRHPERVSALVLFGGYPQGWRVGASDELVTEREAIMTLTKTGWGQDNPAYRHIFSATFMPGASAAQLAWFDNFQRQTTSAQNAVRFLSAFGDIDVRSRLAQVSVPTLVLHSRGDRRIPWEVGRDTAAAIPNAKLVTLESDNHLLLAGEPAADAFVAAVNDFLKTLVID